MSGESKSFWWLPRPRDALRAVDLTAPCHFYSPRLSREHWGRHLDTHPIYEYARMLTNGYHMGDIIIFCKTQSLFFDVFIHCIHADFVEIAPRMYQMIYIPDYSTTRCNIITLQLNTQTSRNSS